MATPAQQQTPVYNSIIHHTPLQGPVEFGVLDLHAIHHMFYEAAFWRVQAMNSHITTADAFDHDWHTTVMYCLVAGLGGPSAVQFVQNWGRTESVDNGPPSKLAHLQTVLGRQMCDQYWETMHTRGVAAAQGYANSMEVLRNQARAQVMEMYRTTTSHNLALAQQAEATRKTFVVILAVAEVSMVVVGCMITFGVGGPAIVGASSASAGWISTGVSLGYGISATAVQGKPGVWKAVGVKTGQTAGKKAIGLLAGKAVSMAKVNVADQTTGYEGAVAAVQKISARYGVAKALVNRVNVPPSQQALEAGLKRVQFVKGALPLVFGAVSIFTSLQKARERWDDD